jgi:transglutaminase-like putative cysteine protease
MIYEVVHTTRYDYSAPVVSSFAELRQLPGDVDGQVCVHRVITTDPAAEHQRERRDYFGNLTAVMVIRQEHTRLVVTSSSRIDTTARPTVFGADGRSPWRSYTSDAAAADDLSAVEFALDSPLVARSESLAVYARPSFTGDIPLADGVMSLCGRIHADFTFDAKATEINTPLEEVLAMRRGVCQDFAHVMVGALRSLGLPASYVSGYLETVPPPGTPRLVGVDRSHAWVGVYLGDGRWIGVDPTNNQIAGPSYITVARGRDYADVPPLKGVIFTDADESRLTVSVDVVACDNPELVASAVE